jgi:hypothetical protein
MKSIYYPPEYWQRWALVISGITEVESPNVPAPDDGWVFNTSGNIMSGDAEVLGEKSDPVPLRPQHIPPFPSILVIFCTTLTFFIAGIHLYCLSPASISSFPAMANHPLHLHKSQSRPPHFCSTFYVSFKMFLTHPRLIHSNHVP